MTCTEMSYLLQLTQPELSPADCDALADMFCRALLARRVRGLSGPRAEKMADRLTRLLKREGASLSKNAIRQRLGLDGCAVKVALDLCLADGRVIARKERCLTKHGHYTAEYDRYTYNWSR